MKLGTLFIALAICQSALSEEKSLSTPTTITESSSEVTIYPEEELEERDLQSYGGGGNGGGGGPSLVSPLQPPKSPEKMTVYRALRESPFSTFTTLLRKAKFAPTLNDRKSGKVHTVFAATNAAYDGIPVNCLDRIWNRANLIKFMGYHISQGLISANDIRSVSSLSTNTLAGKSVKITNGADIILHSSFGQKSEAAFSEWQTMNGIVHVIEPVLRVPDLPLTFKEFAQMKGHSEFMNMINLASQGDLATGCVRTGRTVFMPTNNAVKAFAKQIGASGSNAQAIFNKLGRNVFVDLVKNFFIKGRVDTDKMKLKATQGKTMRTLATKREKVGFQVNGNKYVALLGKEQDIKVSIQSTQFIGIGVVNVVSSVLSTAASREVGDDDDDDDDDDDRRMLRAGTE